MHTHVSLLAEHVHVPHFTGCASSVQVHAKETAGRSGACALTHGVVYWRISNMFSGATSSSQTCDLSLTHVRPYALHADHAGCCCPSGTWLGLVAASLACHMSCASTCGSKWTTHNRVVVAVVGMGLEVADCTHRRTTRSGQQGLMSQAHVYLHQRLHGGVRRHRDATCEAPCSC